MTAAMLCGIAGIEQKTLENSAAYLKTWIARLKSNSRLLVSAASQAYSGDHQDHQDYIIIAESVKYTAFGNHNKLFDCQLRTMCYF
jgi:antirestriction protein ArdC